MAKKSLARNSLYNVFYKGFTALFPLFTTTYIARTLLPEKVGLVSYANTIVTYFTTVAALGIPNYGVKAIASAGADKTKRTKTFFELYFINAISTALMVVAYYLIVNNLKHFSSRTVLFDVMGIMIILNFFNVDWFFQGIEEYRIIAVRGTIMKVVSFLSMLIFVHSPGDYVRYAFILCMATGGNYLFNMAIIRRYLSHEKCQLNFKSHISPVLILLASTLATEIYTMLDTIMLEYFHGSADVAYYSNAIKIVRMVYTLVIAMVATFYPRISFHVAHKEFQRSNHLLEIGFKMISFIALPSMIGLFLCSDEIVLILFGAEYMETAPILRVASVLVFIFSLAYLFGHIILMAAGRENRILQSTIAGAFVNAIINLLLIPRFAGNGAIFASVIAELTVTSVLLINTRDLVSVKIGKHYIISEVLALTVMSLGIIFIKSIVAMNVNNIILLFVAEVLIAVVLYLGILTMWKNEIVELMINKVMKGKKTK